MKNKDDYDDINLDFLEDKELEFFDEENNEQECEHNHNDDCCCGHNHYDHEYFGKNTDYLSKADIQNIKTTPDLSKQEQYDDSCDLDPNKICDNCGKCLDQYNTDKDGFVKIKIDKIDNSEISLDEIYKMYGLDDED